MNYKIFPLGDSALTIDYGNLIDDSINNEVIERFKQLQQDPVPGQLEIVPAYSSITLYYDFIALRKLISKDISVFDWMTDHLMDKFSQSISSEKSVADLVRIPVCYDPELAPDLLSFCEEKNLSINELVEIHVGKQYKVYMMGFLPGFSYMGEVDDRIAMRRKPQPEQVSAGSVGIAGKQTGIYPLESPGGWQIIGKTPLKIFDAGREQASLIKAGDKIEFYPISKNEFANY